MNLKWNSIISDASPEVLNAGKILMSIEELPKIPVLGSHPKPIKSETVKVGTNIGIFLKLSRLTCYTKLKIIRINFDSQT